MLFTTSASCLIASWPWSDMLARRSAHAFTIYTSASAAPTLRGHWYHEAAGVRLHLQSTWHDVPWLPQSTIGPLRRAQQATARVTLGLSSPDHVRPALKELHWLPVAHRIQYKVVLLMFMVHDNRCPVHISESVQPVSSNPVRQRLRSASSLDYIVPRTETKFLCCRSDCMEQSAWVCQIRSDSF